MSRIILIPALLLLGACDMQGSTQEETKELVQAVKDGDKPGSVGEEAGEVVDAVGRDVSGAFEKAGDKVEKAVDDAKKIK